MKKIILSGLSIFTACMLFAQPGKTPAKPTPKPAPKPAPLLKTFADSLSYVIGEVAAFTILQQNPSLGEIKPTNAVAFMKAYNDVREKKPTLMDDLTANTLLNNYMSKVMEAKAKPRIDSGRAFLAQNKLRKEVKSTSSGLQYEVITEGTGIKPTAVDTFVAHYRGTFLNGTEFDASANRGSPLTLAVNQVVKGWIEGLQLMSVGSKYKLYVPHELGYGPYDYGNIPGGSLLIFELELLDVRKKKEQ
jgi:FKBP-type peptidyl-prolyl cis-trans isomerase FklB